MSYVAHQYSRVDFYSSLEVNLSLYYGGVVKSHGRVFIKGLKIGIKRLIFDETTKNI